MKQEQTTLTSAEEVLSASLNTVMSDILVITGSTPSSSELAELTTVQTILETTTTDSATTTTLNLVSIDKIQEIIDEAISKLNKSGLNSLFLKENRGLNYKIISCCLNTPLPSSC